MDNPSERVLAQPPTATRSPARVAPMNPQVDQVINNKYRLLRLIGEGGMGSVWEARHELLHTNVALKFLHGMLAKRQGLAERFLQEAQVSARIKSAHVVQVSDVDRTADGLVFMVMELIEGQSLQGLYEQLYERGERLEYGQAFEIMSQVIDGVAAAHRLGIVHRDLKPDNVMLMRDAKGRLHVKILDFGIAKLKASGEMDRGLTRPGMVMGTPEYMAPEQAFSADKVDARADVFSLGVMFFEMLAGRRPVGGDDAHAIVAQYLDGQVPRLRDLKPTVAEGLADAVHKAMSATVEARFATVDDFAAAIAPFAPVGASLTPTPTSHDAAVLRTGAPVSPNATQGMVPPPEVLAAAGSPSTLGAAPDTLDRPPAMAPVAEHAGATSNVPRTGTDSMNAVPDMRGPALAPPPSMTPRPGGTQMGEAGQPPFSVSPVPASPAVTPFAPQTAGPGGAGPYGGGPVAPYPVAHPPPGYGPGPANAGGRAKQGGSMTGILVIAAGATALVLGGLFIAQRLKHTDEEPATPKPLIESPTTTRETNAMGQGQVDGTSPGSTEDSTATQEPPSVVPPPSQPMPQGGTATSPTTPRPTTTNTAPTPSPTGSPTSAPTAPPTGTQPPNPWVIPSALPPLPGFPRLPGLSFPGSPGTQPTTQPPPPSPPPPSTSTSSPTTPPVWKRLPRRRPGG
jgi:serine/threonine protein kinase